MEDTQHTWAGGKGERGGKSLVWRPLDGGDGAMRPGSGRGYGRTEGGEEAEGGGGIEAEEAAGEGEEERDGHVAEVPADAAPDLRGGGSSAGFAKRLGCRVEGSTWKHSTPVTAMFGVLWLQRM